MIMINIMIIIYYDIILILTLIFICKNIKCFFYIFLINSILLKTIKLVMLINAWTKRHMAPVLLQVLAYKSSVLVLIFAIGPSILIVGSRYLGPTNCD